MRKTEIDDIQYWIMAYCNPRSMTEFEKAEKELQKVYEKYGTIDLSLIKELIK